MALLQPAQGTPIREALDKRAVRKLLQTANARDEEATQTRDPVRAHDHVYTVKLLIKNDGSAEFKRYQPVVLGAPAILPAANALAAEVSNTPISASEPSGGLSEWHYFALCDAPIQVGSVGWSSFRGLVLCQIEVGSTLEWCKRADVPGSLSTSRLTVAPQGAARIHWKESGTGTKWALVELCAPENVRYTGKAAAAIADAATTGTVTIWESGSTTGHTITDVQLTWATGGEGISSGTEVFVEWFHNERLWRITGADCEA
jgi:hypothetical protein